MSKVSIYVAYHKDSPIIKNDVYIPMQVGRAIANQRLDGMIGDDTGDNISPLNPLYCEMTATYWAWKNDKDSDYIGLCHYRRFYTIKRLNIFKKLYRKIYFYLFNIIASIMKPGAISTYYPTIDVDTEQELHRLCDNFAKDFSKTIEKNPTIKIYANHKSLISTRVKNNPFSMGHYHTNMLLEIVKEYYPFLHPTLSHMLEGNSSASHNMIIMQRDMFNDYCSIIFDILEKYMQRYQTENFCTDLIRAKAFSRAPGFIAEFVTAAFVEYHNKQKKSCLKYITAIRYNC